MVTMVTMATMARYGNLGNQPNSQMGNPTCKSLEQGETALEGLELVVVGLFGGVEGLPKLDAAASFAHEGQPALEYLPLLEQLVGELLLPVQAELLAGHPVLPQPQLKLGQLYLVGVGIELLRANLAPLRLLHFSDYFLVEQVQLPVGRLFVQTLLQLALLQLLTPRRHLHFSLELDLELLAEVFPQQPNDFLGIVFGGKQFLLQLVISGLDGGLEVLLPDEQDGPEGRKGDSCGHNHEGVKLSEVGVGCCGQHHCDCGHLEKGLSEDDLPERGLLLLGDGLEAPLLVLGVVDGVEHSGELALVGLAAEQEGNQQHGHCHCGLEVLHGGQQLQFGRDPQHVGLQNTLKHNHYKPSLQTTRLYLLVRIRLQLPARILLQLPNKYSQELTSEVGLLLFEQVLVGIDCVDEFAVLGVQYVEGVVFHQSDFDSLVLPLSVDLCLQLGQLLCRQLYSAQVQENLLVAASARRVEAAQGHQLLLLYLYPRLFFDFLGRHSHEVAALVNHSGWGLEHGLLNGHSVLLDQQQLVVDQHEDGDCVAPQEQVAGELEAIFEGDCAQVDEAHIVSEHLDSQDLDLLDLHPFLEVVQFVHVVSELLAGRYLAQHLGFDVGEREDWDHAQLEGQLKGFLHEHCKQQLLFNQNPNSSIYLNSMNPWSWMPKMI